MAAFVKCAIPNRYIGASTATKPAVCGVGSICYETDTGKEFITADGGSTWTQYAASVYFDDVLPLADDASYLGSATLGWKGLHLPDTYITDDTGVVKIRNNADNADLSLSALNLTLSGTTTALTFSAAATIVAASGLTMPAFTLGGAVSGGGQTISDANVTVGASRTLDVSAGTLTLAADQISGDKVEGGTINAVTINTLTLGTGLTGADKPFTDVGDVTFHAGSIVASGSTNGDTLLLRANDTTFITLTTGATDAMTIANATMSGTWLASGTVTVPALTLGGAISGNAQTISNANVTVGASRTLDVSAGTLTLADNQISGDKVEGGTIAAITITALTTSGLAAAGAITVKPSGDTDDYITFATVSNVPVIYGTGAYLSIGDAATTGHSLASEDDLLITGKLEVDGAAYFDGDVTLGTMAIDADSGAVTLVDMSVTDAPADNTEESLLFKIDGNTFVKLYSQADSAGAVDTMSVQLQQDVIVSAGKSITGFNAKVENHTADDILTLAESGSIHTNYGDDGACTLTLPASATAGTTFKFVVGVAQELRVEVAAAAESFIANGTTTTDDGGGDLYLVADDEGEMATFVCVAAGKWLVDVVGTWTATQP